MSSAEEWAILERLDRLMTRGEAAEAIECAVSTARLKLAAEAGALMSWETIPLRAYGPELPAMIQSSWVFILRSQGVTGAERHPNSHQRMASYCGSGDLQVSLQTAVQLARQPQWQSNLLSSDRTAPLNQRWVSIPPNTWHQVVPSDDDWVVVSFHTAGDAELIEERPDPADASVTHMRTYLNRAE